MKIKKLSLLIALCLAAIPAFAGDDVYPVGTQSAAQSGTEGNTGLTPNAASGTTSDGSSGVSEDELFSSEELSTQAPGQEAAEEDKKSLGFSGELESVTQDVFYSSKTAGSMTSYLVGNFTLDARLKKGVKAFANMETVYSPGEDETSSDLTEVFLDFNLDDRVYFRAGKQVLQWGRCSLWNPTDLVNQDKQTFLRRIGYRSGAYGLKFHAPFGTKYNIYGFLDTGSGEEDRDTAGALKFEFLTGKTEMAFSGWGSRNHYAVFGYDISSRLGEVDIAGELSAARRDNSYFVSEEGGTLYSRRKDTDWPVKAALNLRKGFRLGNFNDRLSVATEFFYNQTGYTGNPFADGSAYAFSGPLAVLMPTGTKAEFLAGNGLYDPNYLSRYYGAIFTSISRFIITDMTLSVNYIRNINDRSGILSAGVDYTNINDFSAGLLLSSYLGPADAEYTYSGARFMTQLTFGVSF